MDRIILVIFIVMSFISCKSNNNDMNSKDKEKIIELSTFSLNQINSIFSELNIGGKHYNFNKGKIINPKFNYDFIVSSDTMNFIYLKLFEEVDSIVLGVNKLLCYATILPEFEGHYYPNQSVVFPFNFRFLNQDNPLINITCHNDDDQKFRQVGFDKNLFGIWEIDSIVPYHLGYISDFKLKQLNFSQESVILNDSVARRYSHSGFTIKIDNSCFDFHKILVNHKKMILINTFNDSYEVVYFTKRE